MFKKYRFVWTGRDGNAHTLDFFVHGKKTRRGFLHRACAIGEVPRIDDIDCEFGKYRENGDRLFKRRVCKARYAVRPWDAWPGRECLARLWNRLAALKFVDLGEVALENPFERDDEPEHEDLCEADELFNGFVRKNETRPL